MFSAMDSGTTAVVYIYMYIHQDRSVLHVDVVGQALFTARDLLTLKLLKRDSRGSYT